MSGRRGRAALTALGVAFGICAAVSTLGITATASQAVTAKFDEFTATEIKVKYPLDSSGYLPHPEAGQRLRVKELHGVQDAGLMAKADGHPTISNIRHDDAPWNEARVLAAQEGGLTAAGATMLDGRMYDSGHESRRDRVAVLDSVAATRLFGAPGVGDGAMVYVADVPYAVLGVYQAPSGSAGVTGAVVLPYWTATAQSGLRFPDPEMIIRTELGAVDQVAREVPFAIAPQAPGDLAVLVPPDLRSLRAGVERETQALFLGLALVSLVIGALGVSNVSYVSVLERRAEIGLRRAVGASRRAVAAQFCLESAGLGLIGGVVGTIAGVHVTAITSLAKSWLVILDPMVLSGGPVVGMATGLAAGVYPAIAAARVQPAEALRS
ncbi:ABC transporter permease [Salinispora cortesiana]|uniref:ABC transporter permease n=1 Tax=Salinispora cortesiana TaxID=1305843 RepID=UPI0009B75E7F|nr:ABC transporter permease [Salinispora cortesiana]